MARELLLAEERFAPDAASVWLAVGAATERRRVTRRRFVIGGVAAGVGAIAAATTVGRLRSNRTALPGPGPSSPSTVGSSPRPSTTTTTTTTAAATGPGSSVEAPSIAVTAFAHGRWSTLPPAPISPRSNATAVWTGTEMLVWGGYRGNQELTDGAAYDPARRRWRILPPAPDGSRASWSGLWTGSSLLLWGITGNPSGATPTGARYSPGTGRWQLLPDPPIGLSTSVTTVWTGSAMVALAVPAGQAPNRVSAGVFDPVDDRWTSLAPVVLPAAHPVTLLQAAAVGGTVYLWSRWVHEDGDRSTAGTDSFVLRDATWRPIVFAGGGGLVRSYPVSTGTMLLQPADRVWDVPNAGPSPAGMTGRLLDPATARVVDIAAGPLDHQAPQCLWTGGALLCLTFAGRAAAYDPAADAWTSLPHAPSAFDDDPVAVWTGDSLLVWGRRSAVSSTGYQFTS